MRHKKKDLLGMISTLEKVNRLIGSADFKTMSELAAQDTFEDCQQAAIEVGTYLETKENTDSIISGLEEYCEAIYQVSINLKDVQKCRKLSKKIKKLLLQVQNAIKYQLPDDRREAVFFPYKASMWDSLERVWMAARDDPECDAYVVPIPYYDKNPDGSLRAMHYEGSEYPDYVPIVDWQEYSLEEHRPDVAYIHNPYDEYNYVTTVHPDYYARNLKNYTDKLVYCPYFVGINNSVGEHFCTAAGVLYADEVLVESEAVKEIYMKAIRKYEKENKCSGRFGDLKKKIKVTGFGSPKVERIKRIDREKITIPDDWQQLIRKEDGTNRKIILYNTTVGTALENGEQFFKKVKSVLSTFEQNREVVLLWRPHPLLLSTLYAMRPALYQEFSQMVEAYKEERWGIYDDTADIDRAIMISDAYYGDWSSVVTMYRATGKPIMIASYEDVTY